MPSYFAAGFDLYEGRFTHSSFQGEHLMDEFNLV